LTISLLPLTVSLETKLMSAGKDEVCSRKYKKYEKWETYEQYY